MGQGSKGGKKPLNNLLERFRCKQSVYQRQARVPVGAYIKKYPNTVKHAALLLDIRQNLEKSRKYKGDEITTGREMYNKLRDAIVEPFQCPEIETVVVCNDCGVNSLVMKDQCHFFINSKNRRKHKPIDTSRNYLISDNSYPTKEEWTSFKMNPVMSRQINWYFASCFADEVYLNTGKGIKTIIFDNYIPRGDLFKDQVKPKCIQSVYKDGVRISKVYKEGSCISEGELCFPYYTYCIDDKLLRRL